MEGVVYCGLILVGGLVGLVGYQNLEITHTLEITHMGYSRSIITVDNNYHWLRELESMDTVVWESDDGRPDKLAYKIHECLTVAMRYPEKYPRLAQAAEHYKIRVRGNTVVAEPLAKRNPRRVEAGVAVKQQTVLSRNPVVTNPVTTAAECLLYWREKNMPSITMANYSLNEEEMSKLRDAAVEAGFELVEDTDGLSMTQPGMFSNLTPPTEHVVSGFELLKRKAGDSK